MECALLNSTVVGLHTMLDLSPCERIVAFNALPIGTAFNYPKENDWYYPRYYTHR